MAPQINMPTLAGVSARSFRGEPDIPAIFELRLACALADRVDPKSMREQLPTEADIRAGYQSFAPNEPNLLLIEAAGTLIGLAQIVTWDEAGDLHVYLHLCWLLPEWRGHGIGTAMLRWCQARIRECAAELETGTAVYATNTSSTQPAADALIRADGYEPARRLTDLRLAPLADLPDSALPSGLIERPPTPEDFRPIYGAFKETYRGLWSETPMTEADYEKFFDDRFAHTYFDPTLWRVAWAGQQVAGFIAFEIKGGIGYMPEVAVIPSYRRRGLARALLIAGLRTLGERGITEVRTFTNADDGFGARTLYESVGFRETKQFFLYRKPL